MRSMYLVSPERTTRKSEVRSTADSKAGRIFEYEEEGNQALSYICIANVRRNNLHSRL